MDSDLTTWVAAARPDRALLVPLAVEVGVAYARFDARPPVGIGAHLLLLTGAFAAGIGVNLVELAWDRLGAEPPAGEREAAILGAAALLVSFLCALGLAPFAGAGPLGYGLMAVGLGVVRGAPIFGLETLGWGLGDVATALALGPIAAEAGYASQAGSGSPGAMLAGLPAGLVAASALFARHFTRREVDARLGRTTPVVALGEAEARRALVGFPLAAAAAVGIASRIGDYGSWALAALVPLAASSFSAWRLPAGADALDFERWERIALALSAAALLCIVVALRWGAAAL
jgi:1,4-dihydroxy-2-naphthoate octaprenyltransferase